MCTVSHGYMPDRRMTAVRADESVSQITVEGIKKKEPC